MPQENQYSGRTYLVTGAGRGNMINSIYIPLITSKLKVFTNNYCCYINIKGIGKAVVAELHSLGATVYALSKNSDNLQHLKEEFPGIVTIRVDLSDWDETKKSLEDLQAVDCVINNAAVINPKSFMDITPKDFDRYFYIHISFSVLLSISHFYKSTRVNSAFTKI